MTRTMKMRELWPDQLMKFWVKQTCGIQLKTTRLVQSGQTTKWKFNQTKLHISGIQPNL